MNLTQLKEICQTVSRPGVDTKSKALEEIYAPIKEELRQVEVELKRQVLLFGNDDPSVSRIIEYFFKVPGKRLRPALVLLSGFMVEEKPDFEKIRKLIILAAAIELIHAASLVHDDIVDNELERREQKTLNTRFGNQIAVLAGDLLYVRAFDMLVEQYDKNIIKTLIKCVSRMCSGEIIELKNPYSFNGYLKILEEKTASLTAASCKCSMLVLNAEKEIENKMEEFGYYFGMLYQLVDDCIDKNVNIPQEKLEEQIELYNIKANRLLKNMPDSIYAEKMKALVAFITNYGRTK